MSLAKAPANGFSAFFRLLARLRHGPAVHPRGLAFAAHLTIDQPTPVIPQGDHGATVRLSKGAGTPGSWPDVLGLALRLQLQESADFLFSSAGDGRWTRWLPRPAVDWGTTRYGTLAPYEAGGRWWWLKLTTSGPPVGHSSIHALEHSAPASLDLHLGDENADWHQVGRLELHDPVDGNSLVFDPILNHPQAAVPAPGWLRELRERAYSGSRQGREAPPPVS